MWRSDCQGLYSHASFDIIAHVRHCAPKYGISCPLHLSTDVIDKWPLLRFRGSCAQGDKCRCDPWSSPFIRAAVSGASTSDSPVEQPPRLTDTLNPATLAGIIASVITLDLPQYTIAESFGRVHVLGEGSHVSPLIFSPFALLPRSLS